MWERNEVSISLNLPEHPSLEYLKKLAKERRRTSLNPCHPRNPWTILRTAARFCLATLPGLLGARPGMAVSYYKG
jgi:hypothetical protein